MMFSERFLFERNRKKNSAKVVQHPDRVSLHYNEKCSLRISETTKRENSPRLQQCYRYFTGDTIGTEHCSCFYSLNENAKHP